MARITTNIDDGIITIATEYFPEGQCDEETEKDYRKLIQSLQSCTFNSCGGCIYKGLGDSCATHLMTMAWKQLAELCDEKYGKLDDE